MPDGIIRAERHVHMNPEDASFYKVSAGDRMKLKIGGPCAVTFDEQYLITGDESLSGHVKIWDISDYGNINLVSEYYTPEWETHSAHNLYIPES